MSRLSHKTSYLDRPTGLAKDVGKALHSKIWLEHCILMGLVICYRSAGKSKWKSRSKPW